jgi:hypothetical protein
MPVLLLWKGGEAIKSSQYYQLSLFQFELILEKEK